MLAEFQNSTDLPSLKSEMRVSGFSPKPSFLIVSSPQNSKNPELQNIDLLNNPFYKRVVREFDAGFGVENGESLNPNRQAASVVHSVASFYAWYSYLRSELYPGILSYKEDPFDLVFTGHSVGENAPFVQTGRLSIRDLSWFLNNREEVTERPIETGVRRMMAAVGLDFDKLTEQLDSRLERIKEEFDGRVQAVLANRNTPFEGVFSIHIDGLNIDSQQISAKFREIFSDLAYPMFKKPLRFILLPTISNAFHSPFLMLEEAMFKKKVEEKLNKSLLDPIPGTIYSPMLGKWIDTREDALRVLLNQLTLPVDFRTAILNMSHISNLIGIITADVLDITPKMIKNNLEGIRDLPILNIKSIATLEDAVTTSHILIKEFYRTRLRSTYIAL